MRVPVAALALLVACGRLEFDSARTVDGADAASDAPALPVPEYVQGSLKQVTVTPQQLAFALPVTAGDLLVVAVGALSAPTAIGDSLGNSYANVIAFDNGNDGSLGYLWYTTSGATGSDTVSVTYGSADTHTIALLEYAHAAVLDGHASGSGSGSALDSGALVTTAPGDLIVAFTHQSATTTWTPPAGFSVRADNQHTFVADAIAGSAGSYAATLTASPAEPWDLHAIAFRSAP